MLPNRKSESGWSCRTESVNSINKEKREDGIRETTNRISLSTKVNLKK
jgi:hypothetical protein